MTDVYRYHQRIESELARHGLKPLPHSSPQQLRDAVRDLYKYEIRRLRESLLARRIPKADYAGHVIDLRKRYWLLSIPMQLWTIAAGEDVNGVEGATGAASGADRAGWGAGEEKS